MLTGIYRGNSVSAAKLATVSPTYATHAALCELDSACTYAMRRPRLAEKCAKAAIRFGNIAKRTDIVVRAAKLLAVL